MSDVCEIGGGILAEHHEDQLQSFVASFFYKEVAIAYLTHTINCRDLVINVESIT